MNYYKFHIGDYRSGTAHLTNEEDLCYRRLIDMYYDTENEIPLETEWVAKRIRVETEIVDSVLNDMFQRTENGWFHERCAAELADMQHRAEVNKANGGKGGRPSKKRKKPNGNPLGSELKPTVGNGLWVMGNKEGECEGDSVISKAELIYQQYPKKVGKDKAIESIIKALGKVPFDTLMTSVKEYAKSRDGEDRKFTPNPSTWFNQGRWQDEVIGSGATNEDYTSQLEGYTFV